VIRRVTPNTNSKIFDKLSVDKNLKESKFYLIINRNTPEKKYEKFEEFLSKMNRNRDYNTGLRYIILYCHVELLIFEYFFFSSES
jgi:hypothetical protein